MIGKVYKKQVGSSDIVNGIIEQYKASTSTISANSFVEFVNGTPTVGNEASVTSIGTGIKAEKVDDDKVLVLHLDATNYYLYGRICTINGNTISVGSDTSIADYSYSSNQNNGYEVVQLEKNKAFVVHSHYTGSVAEIYGLIVTINGTSITKGNSLSLFYYSGYINSSYGLGVSVIEDNKVFVKLPGTSNYAYGVVCSVSGLTITKGSSTQISNASSSDLYGSSATLDTNKAFMTYYKSGYLYGVVCTITNTNITKGNELQLSTSGYENVNVNQIDKDRVFVPYNYGSDNVYAIVCTVSGTTITKSVETNISIKWTGSDYTPRSDTLSKNKVIMAYQNSDTSKLNAKIFDISGTTISVANTITTTTSTNRPNVAKINNNKAFLFSMFYARIVDIPVTIKESETKIDGITKTECTTSTAGDVWELNQ